MLIMIRQWAIRGNKMNQYKALNLISKRKNTSHVLHLLLSIITGGLWIFVWIICALSNSIENRKIDRAIEELGE